MGVRDVVGEMELKLNALGYYFMDKSEYINSNHKCNIIDSDGYKYYCVAKHIVAKHIPAFVGYGNPYSIENIRLWLTKNNKPFRLLTNKFINAHKYMDFQCDQCAKIFQRRWSDVFNKHCGCRDCRYKKQREINRKPRNGNKYLSEYTDICLDWDYSKNQRNPEEYAGKSAEIVWWKCHICQTEWMASICHRTYSKSRCPKCANKITQGELIIAHILHKNNIKYQREKCFNGCKDKYYLRYDFYLPDYNVCIEYDGVQHYQPTVFNDIDEEKAEQKLQYTQKHDDIKNNYCIENNIKLIRVPYWEKSNIKAFLQEKFTHNNIAVALA